MANANRVPPVTRLAARLTGARLCFGKPVSANGRTVIPVASVRTAGGGGFGRGPAAQEGSGGGGGGALDARPVGFIEITADGTRFERIDDGRTAARALATVALAMLIGARALSRHQRRLPGPAARAWLRRGAAIGLPAPAAAPPPAPPARRRRGLRGAHASQRS